METWSQVAEPTPAARIAQARALVRLGLVDRAWARLQGLAEEDGASAEVLALTAELFLARQWPRRAREVLHRALRRHPDDDALKALWDRMSEPGTAPDLDAVEDDKADVPSLITAAHHLIAAGSHTRARALLERARRLAPDHPQVLDMLWALDGDFALDGTLHELVRRFEPGIHELADLDDEPDHTESVDATQIGPAPSHDREHRASFPTLFRDLEPGTEMYGAHGFDDASAEVTKVTSMADVGSMPTVHDGDLTGEHTEIQRVIERASLLDDPSSDTSFDLSALQSDLTQPELEDDDVVVLTRDETTLSEPGEREDSHLVLQREPPPPARRKGEPPQRPDESESWVRPEPEHGSPAPTARHAGPAPARDEPTLDELRAAYRGGSMSLWILALVGITALGLVALLIVVGLGLLST